MAKSEQITPGMILSISGKLYRVESSVKVTVAKRQPFIKTKLRNLKDDKVTEKNFKVGAEVTEAQLDERKLDYLYLEGKNYLFLDLGSLDQVLVPPDVMGDAINFLKEGTSIAAIFYGETIFSIELPQFLELMVTKTQAESETSTISSSTKKAVLETGATIEVPRFIESGDVIKVDTRTREYIQRV